jgi:hypothetical protein
VETKQKAIQAVLTMVLIEEKYIEDLVWTV